MGMTKSDKDSKHLNRPKKTGGAKKRRQKLHRKRLVALGMSEAAVGRLNPKQARLLLRRPAKVAKSASKKKA